nr:hypothetical protein [Tanacetum cinerariifolium]
MRIEQYFLMTDYSLWEVILNGDSPVPTPVVEGILQPLKFNSHKDVKTLMEAIEKRFGRNTKTKKVQKTLLKQQYENFIGTKASDNAGQAKKETEPVNDYILLPLWTADPPFFQNPKSSQDDGFKPLLMMEKSLTLNVADTNGVNDVGELPFDPDMLALEDVGTFDFSNKDEDDDVLADMNNLDITIQVSPTTTIRIHKDHPLDQVIRDLQSVTQTKNMTKNLEERGNKKDERGIMIRNKARLVAQGHTQEEGNDYNEVFAPVPRIEAIRLFLAYASFKYFMVYQMDVKVLFSMGRLKKMCMYVNHQNLKIQTFLIEYTRMKKHCMNHIKLPEPGMKPCQHICWIMDFKEENLTRPYSSKGTKVIFYLSKFMWMISSLDQKEGVKLERLMHEKFQMSSVRELTFFLGLQVKQKNDGIFISQDKYVAEIIKKFGFTEVKNASTLIETQKPLLKDEDGEEVDVYMYRSMIGSLMYLTSSRPDIVFVVCACARY